MSTLREAAQEFVADWDHGGCGHFAAYAENFRKLLAQEEQEQEPAIYPDEAREMGLEEVALYTHPPRREWRSLTEEEKRKCAQAMDAEPLAEGWPELVKFARAIEAKLKEKNNG